MTKTATLADPIPDAASLWHHPGDILMALIVALLAPMFLCITAGDIGLARIAAIETVNAYRARDQLDLIAVAQIVAFGLAALGSLSLSMEDDLSLAITLRLRSNAVACNRSAEQNRRAIKQNLDQNPMPYDGEALAEPEAPGTYAQAASRPPPESPLNEAFLNQAAAQELAAESAARLHAPQHSPDQAAAPEHLVPETAAAAEQKRHEAMWAIAMVKESGEISASIPDLPLAERRAASIRAASLSRTSHELLNSGASPPPAPI